jgi:hypothetical protein
MDLLPGVDRFPIGCAEVLTAGRRGNPQVSALRFCGMNRGKPGAWRYRFVGDSSGRVFLQARADFRSRTTSGHSTWNQVDPLQLTHDALAQRSEMRGV